MCRAAPVLLVCLLACTSTIQADDAFPSLDQRLGKIITVVEKNFPTEKAIITKVWVMEDGTPVMQAKTVSTNTELTLVENTKAKTAAERVKLYRWTNGVRPEGCPVPPATVTSTKVTSMDGGLVPVLPKKEEPKTVTTVSATTPVVAAPVVTAPKADAVPALPKAPAELKTSVATPVVQTQAPAADTKPATPVTASGRELVGGCEVITVTENGKTRKYKILGTAKDKHGVLTHRCQALDNNEIVTLQCDNCCTTACAPAKAACPPVNCAPTTVKCEPCKPACPPVVAKTDCKPCEPAKVACDPCKPACPPVAAKADCKPCEPAKVACAPCKPACDTKKACDPCATAKACDSNCKADNCNKCGQPAGSCNECKRNQHTLADGNGDCGNICDRGTLYDASAHHGRRGHRVREDYINVPVPGVHLSTCNGLPGGPPPQPMIPAFCTMNSSSVRAYMCAPNLVPLACLYRPFSDCMNNQIMAGIYQANNVNGEAVANTLHLINVLAQSKEWENRQWAAQRLQQATLPAIRPYVEDALVTAAQNDRAVPVKVSAIRTLAAMKSTRPDVVNMLTYAAADMDPRVKEAASDALSAMMKANSIQQAGYSK